MADFGLKYDLKSLQGYAALQKRLAAISGPNLGKGIMQSLGQAAVREQKKFLYTQAVTRRTGQSGRQITVEAATALSVMTVARGTAAWADTGTRPHIIRPKNKRILAWTKLASDRRLSGSARSNVKGGWSYAMLVHHPGTRPHPYMVRGAVEAVRQSGLTDKVIAAWNNAA